MIESRLPVSVDILPPATRLALVLFDIERVVDRAGQEKALRIGNERVIREALTYAPPFAKEIALNLSETRILLISNGFRPEVNSEAGLDQAVDEALKEYSYRPKVAKPSEVAKDIAKRIARIVHPDVADTAAMKVFSDGERVDVYGTSLRLAEAGEAEKAQQVLLETMPRLYLHQIQKMLATGMTFAEIVAQNPGLVPEMETIRWIAKIRLPDERAYRGTVDPEAVKARAKDIISKSEYHARTAGFAMVYGVAEDVLEFAKTRGLEPAGYANENLLKYMKEVAGYVGGTGEFVLRYGNWMVTPYARTLAEKMEELIKALPHAVHYLAQVVVDPDATVEVFNQALEAVKSAVVSVRSNAERYGHVLEDTANSRNTRAISFSRDPSITSIYNKNY